MIKSIAIFAMLCFSITTNNCYADDELFGVHVKQIGVKASPDLSFIAPDGIAHIGLNKTIDTSRFDLDVKYNGFESKIESGIKYTYTDFPYPNVSFYDSVAFEKIYLQKKYLERIKGGAIGVSSPKFYNLSLSTLAKFEDYFTASFEESIYLDKGTLNTAIISLALDSVTETNNTKQGIKSSLNYKKGLTYFGGDYDFAKLELNNTLYLPISSGQDLAIKFSLGYPLTSKNIPLPETYSIGGYNIIRGIGQDELRGKGIILFNTDYNISLVGKMEKEWFWFSWKELAGVLFFDVGKVGDENIFVSHEKYRTSTGCGLVLKLSARDYPFQIGAILAQALETERKPILYLNFSTPW